MGHLSLLILGLLALVLSAPGCVGGGGGGGDVVGGGDTGGGDAASEGDTGGGDAASEGDTGGGDVVGGGDTGGGDAAAALDPNAVVNELSEADQIAACEQVRSEDALLLNEVTIADLHHTLCFQKAAKFAMSTNAGEGPPDFASMEAPCKEVYSPCMAWPFTTATEVMSIIGSEQAPCGPHPDCAATIGEIQSCRAEMNASVLEWVGIWGPHSCDDLGAFFTMVMEMEDNPPQAPACDWELAEAGCDM